MAGKQLKFILTAPQTSSERLALLKIDELINAILFLADKLDNDGNVLDVNYKELVSKLLKKVIEEIQGNYVGR